MGKLQLEVAKVNTRTVLTLSQQEKKRSHSSPNIEGSFANALSHKFQVPKMSHGHGHSSHHHLKATVFVSGIGNDLCSPFFNASGKLHAVRQNAGNVITIDGVGNTQVVSSTGGQPSGAVFTSDGVLYVSDFGHSAILSVQADGQQDLVVGVYEDKPLKGPNSINITKGDIFFTDSGSFGETGLHNRGGSLFTISSSPSGQILKPIALESLAYPSGIAVSHDGKFV